ncbi:hypothetical protein [Flavobacterium sp.]|uniref:hypothetical protein n=1 Tax=Flavobacterium sp. TaxID=239 RepID=UPI00120EF041|nr:hypothetical protein [Flavobacterium sp.]RZJ70510.1 MAG: hypothetical protein EOO49_13705 [Flavobacterium sp.]
MKATLLFLSTLFFTVGLDIAQVRKAYIASPKSEAAAMKFAELVKDVAKEDANKVLVAYKGCSMALKSKHSNFLPDKISFMKEGAAFMDAAAAASPKDIEIRMIRMSVQENVPFIVDYRDKIQEDKNVILANFAKSSKEVKALVLNYAKLSEAFSKDEVARLK